MDPSIWGDNIWTEIETILKSSFKLINKMIDSGKENPTIQGDIKFNMNVINKYSLDNIIGIKVIVYCYIASRIKTLPCSNCSEHGLLYISKNPFPINSHHTWLKWLYDFRKYVALKNSKTFPTYEQYKTKYVRTCRFSEEDLIDSLFFTVSGFYLRSDINNDIERIFNIYKFYLYLLLKLVRICPKIKKMSKYLTIKEDVNKENFWDWIKNIATIYEKENYYNTGETIYAYSIESYELFSESFK